MVKVLSRLVAAIGAQVPLPRSLAEKPPEVDPRFDPEFLDAFGDRQIQHVGGSAQTNGDGGVIPWRYATDLAREAREEASHRVADDEAGEPEEADEDAGAG